MSFKEHFPRIGPAYSGDCATMEPTVLPLPRIKVIDASDPQHPRVSAHLPTPPRALNPHETVQTNDRSTSSWPAKRWARISGL